MRRLTTIAAAMILALGACSSERVTNPSRSATEQILISTAADRAASRLKLAIPEGTKVFVSAEYFEGTDSKYALSAIRHHLLKQGMALVAERAKAEAVVELRAGALSIDEADTLFGTRGFDIPIPLAGPLKFPEIALFKKSERKGVAKFAATSYSVKSGRMIDSIDPKFGYSHNSDWRLLLFFSWRTSDLPGEDEGLLDQW